MPELVEVEYFRQFVQEHLPLEAVIEDIYFSDDANSLFPKGHISIKNIPNRVIHKKVVQVQRYGKYLWLELSSPIIYILFHFGMSGSLAHKTENGSLEFAHVGKNFSSLIQEWPSHYAKLRLLFRDGSELAFLETRKLGKIVFTEQNPLQLSYISCLGFDPILSNPSIQDLYDKIQVYKSAIKTVLLNGSVIAGIGNWMADEILYKAKIHPLELACVLPIECVKSLWEATKEVVQQGTQVRAHSEEFPKDWLFHLRWKKDKAQLGEKGVEILQVGGRTTLYVASHQKLRRREEESTHEHVAESSKAVKAKQQLSEKQLRDIYSCLSNCEKDGITQKGLYNAVKELETGKWEDEQVIKDAITFFSSNGYSISWEDFIEIYRKMESS
ncbi:hypothetical protein GpartN1_g5038.t1 [Galdieria partita]|uniref:Formamidopyrimidine-DNA glycosylase catalytic domain-containing protein n=1 Tax=Galdieria partita TaxID=83374 RepID=A0A9C7Q0H1_9RHOD|nr:hypothetical protein GpartN1_g5038.t1 [Galdieria partita]